MASGRHVRNGAELSRQVKRTVNFVEHAISLLSLHDVLMPAGLATDISQHKYRVPEKKLPIPILFFSSTRDPDLRWLCPLSLLTSVGVRRREAWGASATWSSSICGFPERVANPRSNILGWLTYFWPGLSTPYTGTCFFYLFYESSTYRGTEYRQRCHASQLYVGAPFLLPKRDFYASPQCGEAASLGVLRRKGPGFSSLTPDPVQGIPATP